MGQNSSGSRWRNRTIYKFVMYDVIIINMHSKQLLNLNILYIHCFFKISVGIIKFNSEQFKWTIGLGTAIVTF